MRAGRRRSSTCTRCREAPWKASSGGRGTPASSFPIEVGQIVGIPDDEITTDVDVSAFLEQKRAAFHAHLSQYEPDSPFSTIAAQIFEATLGTERFILARGALGEPRPERSLFAGTVDAGQRVSVTLVKPGRSIGVEVPRQCCRQRDLLTADRGDDRLQRLGNGARERQVGARAPG